MNLARGAEQDSVSKKALEKGKTLVKAFIFPGIVILFGFFKKYVSHFQYLFLPILSFNQWISSPLCFFHILHQSNTVFCTMDGTKLRSAATSRAKWEHVA